MSIEVLVITKIFYLITEDEGLQWDVKTLPVLKKKLVIDELIGFNCR